MLACKEVLVEVVLNPDLDTVANAVTHSLAQRVVAVRVRLETTFLYDSVRCE